MHILFVCWGNICRSPAAECTFRKVIEQRGLSKKYTCDSAGTIGSHREIRLIPNAAGSPGPEINYFRSGPNDQGSGLLQADLIVTMDDFNFSEVHKLMPDPSFKSKVRLCDFVSSSDREVPDPYYGGPSGFEKVLDYWMMGATAYSIISKKNPPKFPSRLDERN